MDNRPSRCDLVLYSPSHPPFSRAKGLRKLGVSEDDVHLATRLLAQIPACPADPNKAERILGYASSRLVRDKALRLLGTTEEEVDAENAKALGSLGVAGRRRSFSFGTTTTTATLRGAAPHADLLAFARAVPKRTDLLRRRHTYASKRDVRHRRGGGRRTVAVPETEIRAFHAQAQESANHIRELRRRITELESKLSLAGTNTPPGSNGDGTRAPSLIET